VGARIEEGALLGDEWLLDAARTLSAFAGQERGPLPAGEGGFYTRLRLGASDDYELLLSIEPAKWPDCERIARELGVPLTRVGEVLEARVLVLRSGSGAESWLEAPGWDHFTSGS
jgi:hypothetical protein